MFNHLNASVKFSNEIRSNKKINVTTCDLFFFSFRLVIYKEGVG